MPSAKWMDYVYDPVNAARITAYVQYISPVQGVQDELRKMGGEDAALADNQLIFPDATTLANLQTWGNLERGRGAEVRRGVRPDLRAREPGTRSDGATGRTGRVDGQTAAADDDRGLRKSRWAPYGLLSPGIIWLVLFFLVPVFMLAKASLSTKPSRFENPEFDWAWSNFSSAFSEYGDEFLRSFLYAGTATILAILIGYPLAYWIATQGGRFKNLLIGLVVVPVLHLLPDPDDRLDLDPAGREPDGVVHAQLHG